MDRQEGERGGLQASGTGKTFFLEALGQHVVEAWPHAGRNYWPLTGVVGVSGM